MAISMGYVFFSIGKIAPLTSTFDKVGAVVVLAFVGPTAATGVWGAIKVVLIVETITSTAELEWSPFRNSSPAVSQVLSFAWKTGLLFSVSNVTVPALIVAAPLLAAPALVISWAFEVITFAGGLLVFLLTTTRLFGMVKRQQEDYLDQFAPVLERLAVKLQGIDTLTPDEAAHLQLSLTTTLAFLQQVQASSPAPTLFKTLARAASTLLVPILITVAQLMASRVI
jgi:hypothetical protein